MKQSVSANFIRNIVAGIVFACAFFPILSHAETVVRTGDSVSITESQVVENDFYAAGGSVTHSGEVKEDIYVVAGSITMNGKVGEDLTAIGGTIQINSPVNDDLRVVGGEVVVSSHIKGDVFVIGGQLKVLSSANIGGSVYFYGGSASIEGVVKGEIMGSAESFTVNSEVGGMDVSAVNLMLGESANVRGDLSYVSVRDLERAPGAVIEGELVRGASAPAEEESGNASLVFMFTWIFTSLCFFLLLRPSFENLLSVVRKDPVKAGLIGLAVVVGAPISSFVLLVTVLGAWLGIVIFLLTTLLFLVSLVLMPILLGGYISGFIFKDRRLDVYSVAIGIAAIVVATYIPVLGGLFLAIAFFMVVGVLGQVFYNRVRNLV